MIHTNILKSFKASALAALCALTLSAAAQADGIFQDAQTFSAKAAQAEVVLDNWQPLQSRYVELDTEQLIESVARKNLGGEQILDLNLFADAQFRGVVEKVEQRGAAYTVHAEIDAEYYGRAMLTVSDAGFLGMIHVDDRIFEIVRLDENTSAVMEVRQLGEHEDELDYVEVDPDPNEITLKAPAIDTKAQVAQIKVLILLPSPYFPIECLLGAPSEAFRNTFAANYESSLDAHMNLSSMPWNTVDFEVVADCQNSILPTNDWSPDLTAFRGDSTVKSLRNQHDADMVVGMVPNFGGSTAGIGYVSQGGVGSGWAYSLVRIDQALSNYSLHHELGHNFGMYHNREQYSGNGDQSYCHYGKKLYKHSNGNFFGRTIMAYGSPTRYGVFSNPAIVGVNGISTVGGIACSQNNSADNEQQYISRAPTIATFR